LQDILVLLVEAYFKPVLDNSSEIGYYKVDFRNVHIKLCRISIEIEVTLE